MKSGRSVSYIFEKQYLDCIDDQGNCFIIYRAELHYLFINIHYSELVFCDSDDATTCKSSLKKTVKPEPGEILKYLNPSLEIKGSWKRINNLLPSYSFRDAEGKELIWNCHHPKTNTEIFYKGTRFTGYGYAETLLLSIKPCNLPLDEIRWGRFHSDEYSVIWLRWKGTFPLNKLYCNGVEYNDAEYGEKSLNFDGGAYQLVFRETANIRNGKLKSLFSTFPWMKIFFNKSVLNTTEIKYKSESLLMHDKKVTATGWSIYEIVTWKS
jgi:hypothetical protein